MYLSFLSSICSAQKVCKGRNMNKVKDSWMDEGEE